MQQSTDIGNEVLPDLKMLSNDVCKSRLSKETAA